MPGYVTGTPNVLLRAEAALLCVGAIAAYVALGASWKFFALLVLLPDLSMLGYLVGPRVGAFAYNTTHWCGIPLIVTAWGLFGHSSIILQIGIIWIAHISFDRMIGAGLKYAEGFRFSHLGVFRVEASKESPSAIPS